MASKTGQQRVAANGARNGWIVLEMQDNGIEKYVTLITRFATARAFATALLNDPALTWAAFAEKK